jgi:hypothetical protein
MWGPGPTIWFIGNVFDVIMGVILVVAGRRKIERKGKIAALLLCVGMLAFKYFAMLNVSRVWERYHM